MIFNHFTKEKNIFNFSIECSYFTLVFMALCVVPPDARVCESRPQVCGSGRCIDLPGGRHTCACNIGYILNPQQGHCQGMKLLHDFNNKE